MRGICLHVLVMDSNNAAIYLTGSLRCDEMQMNMIYIDYKTLS